MEFKNEPENEPTGEQLDAMLRDVQVPSDLKSRLKGIPELESLAGESGSLPTNTPPVSLASSDNKRTWLPYVLAASLLAVAAFTAAQFLPKDGPNVAPGSIASAPAKDPFNENNFKPEPRAIEHVVVKSAIDQEVELLNAQIQELEIARLQSELHRLENDYDKHLSEHPSENEVESMIMALSPQYSLPLGGKQADVRAEMARVLEQYPNTRGAVLAEKFLKQLN